MSKTQIEFTKKKRLRSHSVKYPENPIKKDFIILTENAKYYFHIFLEKDQNQILIKSGQSKDSLKFEVNLELESIKQMCRTFIACYTIEEAFKMFTNLFKNKKVIIQEETKDSLYLILVVYNFLDDREEEVELYLTKKKVKEIKEIKEQKDPKEILEENKEKKNKNSSQKENKVDNEIINDNINNDDILLNNNNINLYAGYEEKIATLFKNNKLNDNQLYRIEKNFEEIKLMHTSLKKETYNIKKAAGYQSVNISNEVQDNEEKFIEFKDINDNEEKEEDKEKIEENIEEEQKEKNEIENEKKDKRRGKSSSKLPKNKAIKIKEIDNKMPKEQYNSKNIPKMVFVKNLAKTATCKYLGDNNFAVFKTINGEVLIAFATRYNSLHCYDLDLEKITKRIKEAHSHEITNIRYSLDKIKNRDLLLTICDVDKNLKVWNIGNKECILNLDNIYNSGNIYSSCFLIDEIHLKHYLICVNSEKENLKIFDFSGKKINEINNSGNKSFLVDSFYNSKSKKYYIIVGCEKYIVSYNFPERTVFHKYSESKSNSWNRNFVISTKEKEVKLIESDSFGYIRIWDFNKGDLIKKIFLEKKKKLRAICLWSYKYLFVSAEDKKVKLIDLENNVEIDNLKVNDLLCTLKKIESKKLGECLIFQGKVYNAQIKLWRNENSK